MSTTALPLDATAIHDRLAGLLEDRLNLEVPSADTDLLGEGLLDSLALVELIVLLEEEFDVQVALEDLELDHFRSPQAIVSFIAGRRRERAT